MRSPPGAPDGLYAAEKGCSYHSRVFVSAVWHGATGDSLKWTEPSKKPLFQKGASVRIYLIYKLGNDRPFPWAVVLSKYFICIQVACFLAKGHSMPKAWHCKCKPTNDAFMANILQILLVTVLLQRKRFYERAKCWHIRYILISIGLSPDRFTINNWDLSTSTRWKQSKD